MENVLTPTLDAVLASVVQQLANFFGTTTAVIMEKFPEFLVSYAWYSTLSNLGWQLIVIPLVVSVFGWLGLCMCCDVLDDATVDNIYRKMIIISFIVAIVFMAKNILICAICPEIVGMEALLAKIKTLS